MLDRLLDLELTQHVVQVRSVTTQVWPTLLVKARLFTTYICHLHVIL